MTPHFYNDVMNIYLELEDLASSEARDRALDIVGDILDKVEIGFDGINFDDLKKAREEYNKCFGTR